MICPACRGAKLRVDVRIEATYDVTPDGLVKRDPARTLFWVICETCGAIVNPKGEDEEDGKRYLQQDIR